MLTRLALRASRRAIAISASARDDLAAAYHVPLERFAVTPLAADPRFRPQPPAAVAAVRAKYRLPARYILSLASNKPHKNLPRLVEAFAQVLQMADPYWRSEAGERQLVIAGHWDPRHPEARALVERLGLQAVVRFLPGVAEADLPALLTGVEVFAFPSLYEGFGLPPLEALACGAPVLCGDTSSLPEVVGDAALRVDTRSVAALADALARLLDDAALREQLRAAGPARAGLFSWQRTAQATLAVYQEAG
jgi:glycosyltransferase involved in cell wall biosynthesis